MAPEGHKLEKERQKKRVPAIPEQALASRKLPEEEDEEATVHSPSQGPRCWLGACAAGGWRKRTKGALYIEHA